MGSIDAETNLQKSRAALKRLVALAPSLTNLQRLSMHFSHQNRDDNLFLFVKLVGGSLRAYSEKYIDSTSKETEWGNENPMEFLNPLKLESLKLRSPSAVVLERRLGVGEIFPRLKELLLRAAQPVYTLQALANAAGALERLQVIATGFQPKNDASLFREALSELSMNNVHLREIDVAPPIPSAALLLDLREPTSETFQHFVAESAEQCRKMFPSLPSLSSLRLNGLPALCNAARLSTSGQKAFSLVDDRALSFEERARLIFCAREIISHSPRFEPSLISCAAKLQRLSVEWKSSQKADPSSVSTTPLLPKYFLQIAFDLFHQHKSQSTSGKDVPHDGAVAVAAALTAEMLQVASDGGLVDQDLLFVGPHKRTYSLARWYHVQRLVDSPQLCPKPLFKYLMFQLFDKHPRSGLIESIMKSPFFEPALSHPSHLEKGPIMTHLLLCLTSLFGPEEGPKMSPAVLTLLQLHQQLNVSLSRISAHQALGILQSAARNRVTDAAAAALVSLYNFALLNTELAAKLLYESTGSFGFFRTLMQLCYCPKGGDLPPSVAAQYASSIWRSLCHIFTHSPSKLVDLALDQACRVAPSNRDEFAVFAEALVPLAEGLESLPTISHSSIVIFQKFFEILPAKFKSATEIFRAEKERFVALALAGFSRNPNDDDIASLLAGQLFPFVDLSRLVPDLAPERLYSYLSTYDSLYREDVWTPIVDGASENQLRELISAFTEDAKPHCLCVHRCRARLRQMRPALIPTELP